MQTMRVRVCACVRDSYGRPAHPSRSLSPALEQVGNQRMAAQQQAARRPPPPSSMSASPACSTATAASCWSWCCKTGRAPCAVPHSGGMPHSARWPSATGCALRTSRPRVPRLEPAPRWWRSAVQMAWLSSTGPCWYGGSSGVIGTVAVAGSPVWWQEQVCPQWVHVDALPFTDVHSALFFHSGNERTAANNTLLVLY